ncbi:MAG: DoxX family protein [Mycobacterium sp.]
MSVLGSPKTYAGLAAFHAVDAVGCAVQFAPIKKVLDDLDIPEDIRPVFPVVKGAAAIGLASVTRFTALARLTTAMLTLYFILAVGAHVRAKDKFVNTIPAATFLTTFALMTVKGPDQT